MLKRVMLLSLFLPLVLSGCCTLPDHKNLDLSGTKPPEYIFNPLPVFTVPGAPETYNEALQAIVDYDGHVEDLYIWIEGTLQILQESGAIINIPEQIQEE